MKLGKRLAALPWLLVVTVAVRIVPVLKPTGLEAVGLTNNVLPEKPVKKKEPSRKPFNVAVAVTGVVEPPGKNAEALSTCIEDEPAV